MYKPVLGVLGLLSFPVWAQVVIDADQINFDYQTKVVTASGNITLSSTDLSATTDTMQYNYITDTLVLSGETAIRYKDNYLNGSHFVIKLKDTSIIASQKSTLTINLDE